MSARLARCGPFALLALAAPLAAAGAPPAIPARPDLLAYPPLVYEPPRAEAMRHVLPSGVVVYVAEDRSLPLVSVVLHFRTGAFREPADKPGLAALAAALLRVGGTAAKTPEEFDEAVDFLAAQIGAASGDTGARASLNVLTPALGEGLDLLFEMLRAPRFDESRLAVEKGKALEAMKQRNDDADDLLAREWSWLADGRDHFGSRRATAAQLESITRADLVDFHRRTFGPEHLVVAVSGDVDAAAIVSELGRRLGGWRAAEPAPWPPEGPRHALRPGLYRVEKAIPQGKVRLGHRSLRVENWLDPEIAALEVMNHVLGGASTSRLYKRIRSDEGLVYGVGSNVGFGVFWPGLFTVGYASKNPTVAFALELVLEELAKLRAAPVAAEELATSKAYLVERFPRNFETAAAIAGTYAQDELIGRPHEYWYGYRQRVEAVSAERVLEVARNYLEPRALAVLVVGPWDEIAPGDPEGRAAMAQFFAGQVEALPLRDPLTLEPIAAAPAAH
jgi:predicted Zn-dependent peptidase